MKEAVQQKLKADPELSAIINSFKTITDLTTEMVMFLNMKEKLDYLRILLYWRSWHSQCVCVFFLAWQLPWETLCRSTLLKKDLLLVILNYSKLSVMRTTQKHSTSIFLWASSWCLPSGTGLMMIMLQMIADSSHTLAALDACYPRVVNMQKVCKPMEMFSSLHEDLCSPHLCYSLFMATRDCSLTCQNGIHNWSSFYVKDRNT